MELNEILEILKQLMSFKTTEDNIEAMHDCFSYIKKILPSNLYFHEHTYRGKPNYVIANTPDKNFDIVFSGHIDVVPSHSYEYYEDELNIYGRGTSDMKGGIAVFLELLIKNKSSKKIALFITTDEEIDGYSTERLLKKYNTKFAIIPDGGTNFELIKEQKGLLQLKVSIKTKEAHSSQPWNGVNAITKLVDIYNKLIECYPLPTLQIDYKTSIVLSKIKGGDVLNKVPGYAEMYLDIRRTSNDTKDEIISKIKELNQEVEVEIVSYGSLFKTDINDINIKKYIEVSEKILNRKIKIRAIESTSDGIYFSDKNIPTIIMNPNGCNPHCENEHVEKKSLLKLYQIYKEMI